MGVEISVQQRGHQWLDKFDERRRIELGQHRARRIVQVLRSDARLGAVTTRQLVLRQQSTNSGWQMGIPYGEHDTNTERN